MKIAKNILLLLIIFISSLWVSKAAAAEEKTVIRVGLSNSSFSTFEFNEAAIITSDSANVTDMPTGTQIKGINAQTEITAKYADGKFTININGKDLMKDVEGPIVFVSNGKLGIKNLSRKGNPAYYKGFIELKATPSLKKFNIINVLDLQTYLKGVVPNETPVSFGLNALKAQAIAARNYANRPQNAFFNYDICDSTACQVYYGANSETPISNKAVDETLGIYAMYNKEPILALYSSTGGGITENYSAVYGNGTNINTERPYLKSVTDNRTVAKPKTEEEVKKFYSQNIPSFDMKSPRHRWKVTFDRFELEDTLDRTLFEQSQRGLVYPKFNKDNKVEGLEDIKVVKRGESGKAIDIEIKAVSGSWRVKKELGIRRTLKKGNSMLSSGNFFVEKSYDPELKEKNVPEPVISTQKDDVKPQKKDETSVFAFLKQEEETTAGNSAQFQEIHTKKKLYYNSQGKALPRDFTITGGGFGHGVGMSQYGAGFLSSYGVGYDAILRHYYSGIKLGTMPKAILYNEAGLDYIQNLYFNGRKSTITGPSLGAIEQSPMKTELKELLNESNKDSRYILNIDNSKKPSELEFYINAYRFNPPMASYQGKILKMDITKYLKEGKNTLVFKPLKQRDKDKSSAFWVEIEK